MYCEQSNDLSDRHYDNKDRKNSVHKSQTNEHYSENNNNEVKPKCVRRRSFTDLHFGVNLIYETPLSQSDNEVSLPCWTLSHYLKHIIYWKLYIYTRLTTAK